VRKLQIQERHNGCRAGCQNKKERSWHLLCAACWNQVPKELQDRVWTEYRKKRGSGAHMDAIRDVFRFFHKKEVA
jgi:hypothetical protein